jgi:hypothetical protein
MSGSPEKGPNAYTAFMVTALVSAGGSVGIVLLALNSLKHITDSGMWAIAVMCFAPALLGIGVSFFIQSSSRSSQNAAVPNQPNQPNQPLPTNPVSDGSFREARSFDGRGH